MAKSKQSQVRSVCHKGSLCVCLHSWAMTSLQPQCNSKGNYSSVQDLMWPKADNGNGNGTKSCLCLCLCLWPGGNFVGLPTYQKCH